MRKYILVSLVPILLIVGCSTTTSNNTLESRQLLEAIRSHDIKTVKSLVASGKVDLDPPTRPNQVNKALAYASIYGNLEIVKFILSQEVEIDGRVSYDGTALLRAIEAGNNDIAEYLIHSGADVNTPNAFGISAMVGFAILCNTKLIDLALGYGGKINQAHTMTVSTKNYGQLAYNPIQWAVGNGNLECVKHLVAKGAATDVVSRNNETLLDMARKQGNPELISFVENEL